MLRQLIVATVIVTLAFPPAVPASVTAQVHVPLTTLIRESYLELLEHVPSMTYSDAELEAVRRYLESEKKAEDKRLKALEEDYKDRIQSLRKQLDALNKRASHDDAATAAERKTLQCEIVYADADLRDTQVMRQTGLPVQYENKFAKLDLIQQWPAMKRGIEQKLASGQARNRPHGDVEDIGVRVVGEGQEKDIETGRDAVREMEAQGLLPTKIEDPEVTGYVEQLARVIEVHSDLRVPLKVTVLDSEEINAFALPGGFLFVNTGLIVRAGNESELAGVLAHEIAHITARHGARLMKRATIANIFYQAAQIAAIVFTGGAAGIGTYYALQYGFFGLGLVLDLALLGVSRDFEMEADQLGVQYAWKAGFDPRGFITFFYKMASEEGYVISASFFRTHPAFFDRIVTTFSEIAFLPGKEGEWRLNSSEFIRVRDILSRFNEEKKLEEKDRPTLRRLPDCPPREKKPTTEVVR
jgi:Zn-dependent protease with chaperone function